MFTFTVRPDGGESYDVEATTRDVLAWERANKGVNLKKLEEAPSLLDFYKIAHFAVRRQQLFTGSLDDFMDTCDIEVHDTEEDGEPDPTNAAR